MKKMIAHLLLTYRYLILFPLAFVEGPIVAFVVGILAALGYFNPVAAYVILLFGDIVPDTIYYLIGRYGEKKALLTRLTKKIGVTAEHFGTIAHLWHRHTGKTMFFGKLAYGLAIPFLISAGFVGLPFSRFMIYALPVTILQYAVLLTLGYYFGGSFVLIGRWFKNFELGLAAVVVFAAVYYLLALYFRRKLLEQERQEENHD